MSAPPSTRAPLRRRDPRTFTTIVLAGLATCVLLAVWAERRTGWLGIAHPGRQAQAPLSRVPDPPTSGGYLSPVPGGRPPAAGEYQPPPPTRVLTAEELRIERQRCLAALDMRNMVRHEARQACRQLLGGNPVR